MNEQQKARIVELARAAEDRAKVLVACALGGNIWLTLANIEDWRRASAEAFRIAQSQEAAR